VEDGVRIEIEMRAGRVIAVTPAPGPRDGERIDVSPIGGLRFPKTDVGSASFGTSGRDP
jgi:hypothetical protein